MNIIVFLLAIPLFSFSFFGALIPGEPLELILAGEDDTSIDNVVELPLTRLLFFPLGAERRRRSADNCIEKSESRLFHRNIDVCRRVVVKNFTKPDRRGDLFTYDPTALPYVEGVTLASRNLRYANFFSSVMPIANLTDSDLRGANFVGADLRFSSLAGADLRGARFANAVLIGAFLNSDVNGNLSGADFDGAILTCANLSGSASAKKASFANAMAPGADFTGINLEGASFRNAVLYGADFTVTAIDLKTEFNGAKIVGADFRGLTFPKGTLDKDGSDFMHLLGDGGGAIYPSDDPMKTGESKDKSIRIAYDVRNIKTQKHNIDYDGNGGAVNECREKLKKLSVKLYPD